MVVIASYFPLTFSWSSEKGKSNTFRHSFTWIVGCTKRSHFKCQLGCRRRFSLLSIAVAHSELDLEVATCFFANHFGCIFRCFSKLFFCPKRHSPLILGPLTSWALLVLELTYIGLRYQTLVRSERLWFYHKIFLPVKTQY